MWLSCRSLKRVRLLLTFWIVWWLISLQNTQLERERGTCSVRRWCPSERVSQHKDITSRLNDQTRRDGPRENNLPLEALTLRWQEQNKCYSLKQVSAHYWLVNATYMVFKVVTCECWGPPATTCSLHSRFNVDTSLYSTVTAGDRIRQGSKIQVSPTGVDTLTVHVPKQIFNKMNTTQLTHSILEFLSPQSVSCLLSFTNREDEIPKNWRWFFIYSSNLCALCCVFTAHSFCFNVSIKPDDPTAHFCEKCIFFQRLLEWKTAHQSHIQQNICGSSKMH